jgi:DNA mismatch repair ATPase MutS
LNVAAILSLSDSPAITSDRKWPVSSFLSAVWCWGDLILPGLGSAIGGVLGSYVGARIGEPTCFPKPASSDRREFTCTGLYDVCLALSTKRKVVGNDLLADARELVVITGANQGGKSTFLRSVGLAQMMMQAGIFAPAESFSANIVDGVFTHYKREEDAAMESGKLDEELGRMSDIVDHLQRNALVLFNESFAATNEREGSEIAGEIVNALIGKGVKVFFVTHMYELARGLHDQDAKSFLFLRAERGSDGRRTFKLVEGEPLRSSFGEDLYDRIFKPAEAA